MAVPTIEKTLSCNAVKGMEKLKKLDNENVCESCCDGKQFKSSHKRVERKSREILELVHTDLIGPINPLRIDNQKFIQLLVDNASGAIWGTTLKRKSDALTETKNLINIAQNSSRRKVRYIRTDGGGELCSQKLEAYFTNNGITHQITPPYSPESNS